MQLVAHGAPDVYLTGNTGNPNSVRHALQWVDSFAVQGGLRPPSGGKSHKPDSLKALHGDNQTEA